MKRLCKAVIASGRTLQDAAREAYPEVDLSPVFDHDGQMGDAADQARAFCEKQARFGSAFLSFKTFQGLDERV